MKTIGELYRPELSFLPIGGTYTMDIEHAIKASEWLNTKFVIPMHYNTFDAIKVDLHEFETKLNKIGISPIVLKISENYNY